MVVFAAAAEVVVVVVNRCIVDGIVCNNWNSNDDDDIDVESNADAIENRSE